MLLSILSSAFLAILASPIAAQRILTDPDGAQFILFQGTVSGETTWTSDSHPEGKPSDCPSMKFGPFETSTLLVGINPPWDDNPFFFELYHYTSGCPQPSDTGCKSLDSINTLDFQSAGYACPADSPSATSCELEVQQSYLDLENKTKTQRLDINGKTGYQVEGKSDTWLTTTTANQVSVTSGCNWFTGLGYDGWSWSPFYWNSSSLIDYTVNFTNEAAAFRLRTTMVNIANNKSIGDLTLSFTGTRNSTARSNVINLDTGSSSTPHFKFLNGSDIAFAKVDGSWAASALPASTSSGEASSTGAPTGGASNSGGATGNGSSSGSGAPLSTSRSTGIAGMGFGNSAGVIEISIVVTLVVGLFEV